MKHYDYVLCDWDGTIVKSLDVWLYCLKNQLEKHGYYLNDKDIGANYELFRDRAQSLGVTSPDKIINIASKTIPQHMKDIEICDGARELLSALKLYGLKMALVTNSTKEQVYPLLNSLHLEDNFDAIVSGDIVNKQKPDSESANIALKLIGGTPERTVMIGDSSTDIVFSKNSEIDSILFHPQKYDVFYDLEELKTLKPTYVVSDLRDIAHLIRPFD